MAIELSPGEPRKGVEKHLKDVHYNGSIGWYFIPNDVGYQSHNFMFINITSEPSRQTISNNVVFTSYI